HASALEAIDALYAAEAEDQRARVEERERLLVAVAKTTREHGSLATAERAWQAEWRSATAPLALGELPSGEELEAALEKTVALARVGDAAKKERKRAELLEREAREIEAEIGRLTDRHAPDLSRAPASEAGAKLLERHRRARAAREERARIE